MTAQSARRRAGLAAAAAAGAVLMLSGCAAGQQAQSAEETAVIDGVAADTGPVSLRALSVSPPTHNSWAKGGTAPLQLVIVNSSRLADQLTSVSTPMAHQVRVSPTPLTLPPGQAVSVGSAGNASTIVLQNLNQQLFPAQSFPITFTFARAGTVTVTVAVHLTTPPSNRPSIPDATVAND